MPTTAHATLCPETTDIANLAIAPCVIIMVGLPARGKTYIAKKLTRYLNWTGIDTRVFNVGDYRRNVVTNFTSSSDFFRPDNIAALEIRDRCAMEALEDLCRWLRGGGEVAVYDATNSNRSRRRKVLDHLTENGFRTFFIESICYDEAIIEANIMEVKISSPDYRGQDIDKAIDDFKMRIHNYETQYEAIDDTLDANLSFIKIFNQGEKYLVNRVCGHVESRIVYYLMNIHVVPRTIYITRHGEALMNVEGRIGGESDLTTSGLAFARELKRFVTDQQTHNLRVWTSLLKQTVQTAAGLENPKEHWKALNELDSGICEGLTYNEMEEEHPVEYKQRCEDKFHYRYQSGESYQDVVARLEPVIMELERQENIMVVSSQAVSRCLLAYLLDKSADELPYLEVPLHTVFKLTPKAYGCIVEKFHLGGDAVDTHRPRSEGVIRLSREERKIRRKRTSECQEPDCCAKPPTNNLNTPHDASPSPSSSPHTHVHVHNSCDDEAHNHNSAGEIRD